MASFKAQKNLLLLTLLGIIALGLLNTSKAQVPCGSSSCTPDQCCSKYDNCGTGEAFCGDDCRGGACTTTSNGVSVADLVTPEFFSGIKNKGIANNPNCPDQSFYSRDKFLEALNSYPRFGTTGAVDDSKREIAAFFAHATHETGYFCHREETGNQEMNYCDTTREAEYPCNPNKRYNGRGPLQLTWNYNYGAAAREIHFNGLESPEIVANDPLISFKAALWFWFENVRPVISQGFGATIQKVNGDLECGGKDTVKVQARVDLYKNYCQQFGVDTGNPNLSC